MRALCYAAFAASLAVLGIAGTVAAQPYGGGYGPGWGMMGGYGPGWGMGPGMMGGYGPGYGMGPGMMGGYGPGWMMRRGYGPGMMGGYGPGYSRDLNLTTDIVKGYLQWMIRNPNLKVGEVKEQGKDEITATIVTKDKDGLVQKLVVNRHTGFFHPEYK